MNAKSKLRVVAATSAATMVAMVACGPATPEPTVVSTIASASTSASSAPVPSASAPVDPLATAPSAEGTVTFVPPKIEEAKLKNGIRVLFIEKHELPIVSIQVVSDRGADRAAPGVCSFMGSMLTQGTQKHGALALGDETERIGASLGSWCNYDSSGVSGKVMSSKLPALISLLAETARTPTFDAKEIERERKKRLTQLQQQKDSPGSIVWKTLQAALYPSSHPYHLQTMGDEAAVSAVSAAQLVEAFHATMVPEATTIVVAGDVSRDSLVAALDKSFGDWKAPTPKVVKVAKLTKGAKVDVPAASTFDVLALGSSWPAPTPIGPNDPRIIIVDRPGAVQSTLQVVRVGVPRDIKFWPELILTNYIFGGHFASRLNMNLREKHAYTYGAGSGFSMWHHAGPFNAGGEIKTEHTAAAVKEILDELSHIRDAQVSDEELAEAQSGLIDQLPGRFATVDEAAGSLATLAIYHLPMDEYATRPSRYRATTKEVVQQLAKEHMRADDMRIVVVGDASKIEAGLAGLGFGKVEVRKKPAEPVADTPKPKGGEKAKTHEKATGAK